ncbi:MAG TPA: NIPSNAP family protein [Vicinamibacterales bacterium]|nr:NIPSNAP family protein [Vicinamibacterales bacterium]
MTAFTPARIVSAVALLAVGFALGSWNASHVALAQSADRVYELRTYTAPEGKLPELLARFRNHTMRIFERHGIKNHGYWVPQDEPAKSNTLIYIISHDSREAAKKNWAAFGADPEWKKVAAESQANGRILSGVVSVYMDPTDYSPMK